MSSANATWNISETNRSCYKTFPCIFKTCHGKSTFLDAQKTLFLYIMMDLDCHFSRISFKHFIHLRLLLSYLYI